jgi:hypothetical protein
MIHVLEIGSKGELLQHFLPKRHLLVAGLLVKRKTGYITHNGGIYKKIDKDNVDDIMIE